MVMPDLPDVKLKQFIEEIYRQPYSLINNNCIHKSVKIAKKARELGKDARLVACWSIVPMKVLRGFPTLQPHMYVEVEGKRVDVSLDPHHEEIYCKNSKKIILLPIKLSKLCWERPERNSKLSQLDGNKDG